MKAIAHIFMHLFLFDAVLAGPTRSPVTYDSETYDVGLEDLDSLYDYDENLSVDQAQVILNCGVYFALMYYIVQLLIVITNTFLY